MQDNPHVGPARSSADVQVLTYVLVRASLVPCRQQDYQHWYPEEVTFQPKLNESAMSREFLRKSLQKEGSSLAPNASGEDRHMALVNRLYASYEKVSRQRQRTGCCAGQDVFG